ncbi:DUF1501 domain-containing protein [Planctopirus hydrillae]|uniref:DUF1501 domain-containing protein n=1 Tax=Planctopirus hydrillae TaxID=1841610 RepID=A0A1C3E6M4_9PLAN|nr:DUF1501 domain-containing protein [Planctopirus hydrillae]ODA28896.1 hypothetical protein A6X21_10365 [Planctopirus hydrillae]
MATSYTCDGIQRRDALKAGLLGVGGLSLSNFLKLSHAGEVSSKAKAKAAIYINLGGGPSHMDTFDMKPNAPAEYRGEFNPIKTNVSGIEICEHLPHLAKQADKFALIRGVSHTLAAHELGTQYVNCGNRPIPSLEFPGYGSVVAKELGGPDNLPAYVAIPRTSSKSGYLGVKYAPLATGNTPKAGMPYSVRGVSLQNGLTVQEVDRRKNLLNDLDRTFAGYEKQNQLLEGMDQFAEQAYSMITSPAARKAFDISQESPKFAEPFGETPFGTSCLLATRLIESGVRFVTISYGGWDTHDDNWTRLKEKQLPPFDEGLAALLAGLAQKGLLDSTAVFVTGEFGRTPKINARAGRDHFARNMFMIMAGGGVRAGQVIGASDDKAMAPASQAITPDDVAASFYHNLGIDPKKEYQTNTGRPLMIVRDGNIIPALFS